jgi:hypothetical protein
MESPLPDARSTTTSVGPTSSTWVKYYDRASRRRHHRGGYKRLRAEVKRRRRTEKLVVVGAALGVLALVVTFYVILAG